MVNEESTQILEILLPQMKAHEQRKYFNAILTHVVKDYLGLHINDKDDLPVKPSLAISAIAAMLNNLMKDNELLKDSMVSALTQANLPALDDSIAARRSVLAALAQDDGECTGSSPQ